MNPRTREPKVPARATGFTRLRWRAGLLLCCACSSAWWFFTGCATPRNGLDKQLLSEAWRTIDSHYVQRSAIQTQALTYGAIRGMVNALDDTGHSVFLTPVMVKEMHQIRTGEFKGIGIEIQMKNGHVVVVSPIDGSPAAKAGLRTGDIIQRVDGADIADWPINRVVERVSGPPGTSVTLTVQDPRTEHTRQVTVRRAKVKLHDVTWLQLPGTRIAHLRIARFGNGVGKAVRNALTVLQKQGNAGVILDLRNNPGGLLDEAVTTASQFLSGGNVLEIKDAKGRITPVPVEKGGVAQEIALVVLINEGSASAAEIVAGALKDRQRAELVGEKTFGTGTVLNEFRLSDGSALLLAVEEWLTPNGRSFWHKGLLPDVAVSLPEDQRPLRPAAERDLAEAQIRASGDQQLLRALELLTKPK